MTWTFPGSDGSFSTGLTLELPSLWGYFTMGVSCSIRSCDCCEGSCGCGGCWACLELAATDADDHAGYPEEETDETARLLLDPLPDTASAGASPSLPSPLIIVPSGKFLSTSPSFGFVCATKTPPPGRDGSLLKTRLSVKGGFPRTPLVGFNAGSTAGSC